VTTAGAGQEALELLAQQPFDLVYLDIRMPEMSGLEVLRRIHTGYPELPVILFTAQPDLNSAVEALRQGAADYLLKPLQPQTLIERTQAILARSKKEQRRRELQAQIEALQEQLKDVEEQAPAGTAPPPAEPGQRYVRRGKLTLDLHTRRLMIGDRTINLPPASFDYLLVLVRHAPNVVDYQTLVAEAQGYQADFREAQDLVKWHVHHIRQAIEPDAHNPTHLINVRGTGYRLITD
jgi:DNA-binding response OmpR family regulator